MKRECHRCGAIISGSRCPRCTALAQRPYNAPAYQAQRRALIAAEPWCHASPCPYPDAGSAANPLTADHVIPLRARVTDGLVVLCRRCNSAKGGRL